MGRGTPVAQNGAETARQHARHRAPSRSHLRVANRVHPTKDAVKPPQSHLVLDPATAEAELEQLPSRDHAMLVGGESRHTNRIFSLHLKEKSGSGEIRPPFGPPLLQQFQADR
jgi:Pyruvate/2-oxoacid:ferredoxin oxidoreductase gamma subunit